MQLLIAFACAGLFFVGVGEANAESPAICHKHLAASGDDGGNGSKAAPYRSLGRLLASLSAGQTGCVMAGAPISEIGILAGSAGSQQAPVTIRSADPHARATIEGIVVVGAAVHDVNFVGLNFRGSPSLTAIKPPPLLPINGDRITLRDVDVSFTRGICIDVGDALQDEAPGGPGDVRVSGFELSNSRIHDCATDPVVTQRFQDVFAATGQPESGAHGVYLVNTVGARVFDNYIYGNLNRGMQLYPENDYAVVEHNLFYGNGSAIHLSTAPGTGRIADHNLIQHNTIASSDLLTITGPDWWPNGDYVQFNAWGFPGPPRARNQGETYSNRVVDNCFFHAVQSQADFDGWGYAESGTVTSDPGFANPAALDFRVAAGSPCAGMLPRERTADPIPPPTPAQEPRHGTPLVVAKRLPRHIKLRPNARRLPKITVLNKGDGDAIGLTLCVSSNRKRIVPLQCRRIPILRPNENVSTSFWLHKRLRNTRGLKIRFKFTLNARATIGAWIPVSRRRSKTFRVREDIPGPSRPVGTSQQSSVLGERMFP